MCDTFLTHLYQKFGKNNKKRFCGENGPLEGVALQLANYDVFSLNGVVKVLIGRQYMPLRIFKNSTQSQGQLCCGPFSPLYGVK